MNHSERLHSIIQNNWDELQKLSTPEVSLSINNKWSKKQILGHLIDSALNNYQRFKLSEAQNHLVFDGYNQNQEVIKNNYQNRDWRELLDFWKLLNIQIAHFVQQIPASKLINRVEIHNFDRICFHRYPKNEKASLTYLIHDYLDHMTHHLKQILQKNEI